MRMTMHTGELAVRAADHVRGEIVVAASTVLFEGGCVFGLYAYRFGEVIECKGA